MPCGCCYCGDCHSHNDECTCKYCNVCYQKYEPVMNCKCSHDVFFDGLAEKVRVIFKEAANALAELCEYSNNSKDKKIIRDIIDFNEKYLDFRRRFLNGN